MSLCRPDSSGRRFEPPPAWCSTPILFRGQSKLVLNVVSSERPQNLIHRSMASVLDLDPVLLRAGAWCGVGVLTITHFLREIAISWRSITSLHAFVLLKHLHAHSKLV